MMFKRAGYFILLLLTLLTMGVVSGSVSAQSFIVGELGNDYLITFPMSWKLISGDDQEGYLFTGDNTELLIVTPKQINQLLGPRTGKIARVTPASVLVMELEHIDNVVITKGDTEEIEFAGHTGVVWEYTVGTQFEGRVIVFEIEDGQYLYADFKTDYGELDSVYSTVEAIVASIKIIHRDTVTPSVTPTPTGGAAGHIADLLGRTKTGTPTADTASATETPEPCLISVATAKTARLHVGPGENRSVIAFLSPNHDFHATGRFVAGDSSVWFQLDKAEVAPDSSAAELWVAEAEIDQAGDCDAVTDASAPPIVPIIPSTGNNNGGSTAGGETQPGTLPAAGIWNVNLDATTYASCLNTNTVSFPTTDMFVSLHFTSSIAISSDGITVLMDGAALAQTAPGNYVGSFDMGGGSNFQIYITVNSSTYMTGKIVGNTTYAGRGCSVTVNFSMSH